MIIGSKALILNGINPGRECRDSDFIVRPDEYEKIKADFGKRLVCEKPNRFGKTMFVLGHKPLEYEIAAEGTTGAALLDICDKEYADLDVLYTLKLSHRYLKNSPNFGKTMADIHLMRAHGAKVPDYLKEWYKARMKFTYNYSHPKLNTTREGFFKDDFLYFDHDDIHRSIAKLDKPAFEYIKLDSGEVQCSKKQFLEVSEEIRLLTVFEESAVLAIERHQYPNDYKPNPDTSFKFALEKVCTSISSGWWREYAWENYHKVMDYYNQRPGEYVRIFRAAVAAGKVGLWKGDENPMDKLK